jgi:hypothetical protein
MGSTGAGSAGGVDPKRLVGGSSDVGVGFVDACVDDVDVKEKGEDGAETMPIGAGRGDVGGEKDGGVVIVVGLAKDDSVRDLCVILLSKPLVLLLLFSSAASVSSSSRSSPSSSLFRPLRKLSL